MSLASPADAVDYDATLIMALETSNKSWVVAAPVPGLGHIKAKQTIGPTAEALATSVEGYRRRAAASGRVIDRVIVVYEAGYGGFWLARWLTARGVDVHVIQPSSVPVERRKRRAKSDKIDADLLLRTLLAWLRGEPRVCTMVAIPEEAEEDARRPSREREELIRERIMLTNRIGAILATLGIDDYNSLRRDRRVRLEALRTALDHPLPEHARAKIVRIIERLELVLSQIAALESQRDAVLEDEAPEEAKRMIKALVLLRSIGAQSATVLVYEGSSPSRWGRCRPHPSQTRTSGIPASGSSRVRFARGSVSVGDLG
jgi:transposase